MLKEKSVAGSLKMKFHSCEVTTVFEKKCKMLNRTFNPPVRVIYGIPCLQTCFGVNSTAGSVHFYHKRCHQERGVVVKFLSRKSNNLVIVKLHVRLAYKFAFITSSKWAATFPLA